MKPHERRETLLNWLQARDAVTSDQAAEELGVSLRTLHRDIAALRLDGYTIHGEPGRGGGIRLDPEARPPAIELELDEVVGLILTTRLVMAAQTFPVSKSARSATAKLSNSLSPDRAKSLERLMQNVVVGQPATSKVVETISEIDGKLLPRFEEAFRRKKGLRFDYVDEKKKASIRTVASQGVLIESPVLYLLATDVQDGTPGMFRMDRISKPRVLESVDFDAHHFDAFKELIRNH